MSEINFFALGVSVVTAFFASFIWYTMLAKVRARLSPSTSQKPDLSLILGELVKNTILAFVLGYLVSRLGIRIFAEVFHLSLLLWIAFPVLILASSVMYEKVPLKLAAIHAGDWTIKILLMCTILALWR